MMAKKQDGVPPNKYTVQNGDTLFDIAQAYYGDGNQWHKISAANGGVKPESLTVAQKLNIP